MKILFVMSRDVMFFHGSGEVEAKLLQVGGQLIGHECHIAGLDSGDFYDYDAYFLFSLRRDVVDLIPKIPQQKPCVIIPQVDDMSAAMVSELNWLSSHLDNFSVLARSVDEQARFDRLFPGRNCFLAAGWFLKPFIYEESLPMEYKRAATGYCLAMVSADRSEGVEEMAFLCRQAGQRLHVVTDRLGETQERLGSLANVTLKNRVAYGSLEWYGRLKNCSTLYEPNPRVTCAVLEALWMGKEVFSPHADTMNSIFGADLVADCSTHSIRQYSGAAHNDVRKQIYSHHANFVTERILGAIGIETDA